VNGDRVEIDHPDALVVRDGFGGTDWKVALRWDALHGLVFGTPPSAPLTL
jgi:hypothetical protein